LEPASAAAALAAQGQRRWAAAIDAFRRSSSKVIWLRDAFCADRCAMPVVVAGQWPRSDARA